MVFLSLGYHHIFTNFGSRKERSIGTESMVCHPLYVTYPISLTVCHLLCVFYYMSLIICHLFGPLIIIAFDAITNRLQMVCDVVLTISFVMIFVFLFVGITWMTVSGQMYFWNLHLRKLDAPVSSLQPEF